MYDDDSYSDSYAGVNAAGAKASNIKFQTGYQEEVYKSFLIAEAEAAQQAAKIREVKRLRTESVEPGKMTKRGQPDVPYFGALCAVNKCRDTSEGGFVEISPKETWRDPIADPVPVSEDDIEDEAFRQDEEIRLRALGASVSVIDQIENFMAQKFVSAAQPAQQFISSVVLPLCRFHSEHPDITKEAGFKRGALPLKFGHQ